MKKITVYLKDKDYESLEIQLNFLKEIKFPEFREVNDVEDLINFYIRQFAASDYNIKEMHRRLDSILTLFSKRKDADMRDLLRVTLGDDDEDDYDDDEEYKPPKRRFN